ncbi:MULTISPECIES: ubiquinol oxidase subunit II [unclassified Rhizobium]|uniref:ubiquinol oxidase subunit II n=1 Tax=unclassified Rhizobium TaxID=2613769 RepID=UPI00246950B6|nr:MULTISPECIES: ubiquinol oxidase subunit II [unclassified Rhizobium]
MRQKTFISRNFRRFVAPLALLPLSGCNMVVMNPTGDIALQERNLILVALGMMLLVVIPVLTLIVVFAFRYRKGRAPEKYDPNFTHSAPIEVVVWSIPLLIIACLGVVTWITTHSLDPFRPLDRISANKPLAKDHKPLDIQVVAMDWKWLFIYPEQGIATVNELALPVDVPVRFSITSTNQFNTFSAPTLAGMIYAMPGMKSMLHAVLNAPGDSWGYSGNYTGAGYSDMRFKLHGVDQAGFDQWAAGIKAAGETLSTDRYVELDKPSEKVPVMHFSAVASGLFDRVLNRCVVAGTECAADIMKKDRALDRDNGGMFAPHPKDHSSMPLSEGQMSQGMPSMSHTSTSGDVTAAVPAAHDHTNTGTNSGALAAPEQQGSNARP